MIHSAQQQCDVFQDLAMLILDPPSQTQPVAESQPASTAKTSKAPTGFTIRTIERDLRLFHEERMYYAEIKICGGDSRVAAIDVEDFAPPSEVLIAWRALGRKAKPPQIKVFEELKQAIADLTEERRKIYAECTIDLLPYRAIPGSSFGHFIDRFRALQGLSVEKLNQVLAAYRSSKERWLREEIQPMIAAGQLCDEQTQRRLEVYARRYPKIEKIQQRFGVQLKGPFRLESFQDAVQRDTALKQLDLERSQAQLMLTQSQAEQQKAETEIQIAQSQANAELNALQQAFSYQQQQIRGAIDQKIVELRSQILKLLIHNLRKLLNKDYCPGKLPTGLKQQFQSLAESAAVLSEHDHSLAEVLTHLNQVQSTATNQRSEHDLLRSQASDLLADLEVKLQTPDLDRIESEGIDRSDWVVFGE
ncbi:hypothetical protein NIES2135_66620 (plasmid) [Leptolyngbya boryana NIES-2135]|jgi:hypothetical protein|uniref:Uncharacterized protein n=1 Tax=Leptolyngbya boryana NIES-2135 TaxID=1973484 RepID=A0A1Z4JSM9_LEPBY|nr:MULTISPECIES: hypothetical protein [Leptolyngbya]BAY59785.1 hypothetical protein NIES2135_66620 [Leptolyngbya boryana NIES-2135]MBD2369661.1 hypothetical protein [Leptolyngbya sp. FACHB-161]MBD2375894.1 hypothetical protein [Leptolyngbya sp. FACHB-238]MBD2400170.1 hypothetical protein [Leptolyngbya sp. FACHB-239]MBD2406711.1 hypothetical protein [Leptolyngbya sp. FACHB-402]